MSLNSENLDKILRQAITAYHEQAYQGGGIAPPPPPRPRTAFAPVRPSLPLVPGQPVDPVLRAPTRAHFRSTPEYIGTSPPRAVPGAYTDQGVYDQMMALQAYSAAKDRENEVLRSSYEELKAKLRADQEEIDRRAYSHLVSPQVASASPQRAVRPIQTEVDELRIENDELKHRLEDLERQRHNAEAEKLGAQKNQGLTQRELNTALKKVEDVEKQRDEAQRSLRDAEAKAASQPGLSREVEQLRQQRDQALRETSNTSSKLRGLQLEFDKVCDKHNHLRSQMTAMKDRVDEAQAQAHRAQTLHLQLEDMKIERQKMRESMRRDYERASEYKRKLEEALNQLKGLRGASLDPRIQALRSAERVTPSLPTKPVLAPQATKELMSPLTSKRALSPASVDLSDDAAPLSPTNQDSTSEPSSVPGKPSASPSFMDALTAFGPSGARPGFRIPSDLLGVDTPAVQPVRVGASRRAAMTNPPFMPSKLGPVMETEPPKETQIMAPISSYDPFAQLSQLESSSGEDRTKTRELLESYESRIRAQNPASSSGSEGQPLSSLGGSSNSIKLF